MIRSHPLPDPLFPTEQAKIVRLLVERVDLAPTGMQVRLRAEELQMLDPSKRIFQLVRPATARVNSLSRWAPSQHPDLADFEIVEDFDALIGL